jgi:hypothetical protein
MHSFSHSELFRLGVTIENLIQLSIADAPDGANKGLAQTQHRFSGNYFPECGTCRNS